jgi:hypothetical protein
MKKFKTAGTSEEIPTGYFPKTSWERYRYAVLFFLRLFAIFCEHVVKALHNMLPQT